MCDGAPPSPIAQRPTVLLIPPANQKRVSKLVSPQRLRCTPTPTARGRPFPPNLDQSLTVLTHSVPPVLKRNQQKVGNIKFRAVFGTVALMEGDGFYPGTETPAAEVMHACDTGGTSRQHFAPITTYDGWGGVVTWVGCCEQRIGQGAEETGSKGVTEGRSDVCASRSPTVGTRVDHTIPLYSAFLILIRPGVCGIRVLSGGISDAPQSRNGQHKL